MRAKGLYHLNGLCRSAVNFTLHFRYEIRPVDRRHAMFACECATLPPCPHTGTAIPRTARLHRFSVDHVLMLATLPDTTTISRFVPREIVAHISEVEQTELAPWKASFSGVVLFADISGFTNLSERLGRKGSQGVEELSQTLNDYFGQLIEIVLSHNGDILKFAGDALLAVWRFQESAPLEAAELAAACSLKAQKALKDWRTKTGDPLSLRIGIGAGHLVTASVGGQRHRWELLVMGNAIREATQAAELTERGTVALGPNIALQLIPTSSAVPLADGHWTLQSGPVGNAPKLNTNVELTSRVRRQLLTYLPAAIHEKIEGTHAQWIGELRRLTILFVNLRGLTHKTPLPIIQKVVGTLQNTLYRFEGSLNKLSADDKGVTLIAAMGLPPLSHEDDEERGVYAALEMKAQLESLGQSYSIGITSGRVFCGIIGNSNRCEYTVIGDAVNLSARFMQAASQDIYCDEETYKATRATVDFETLNPLNLKGKSAPTPVFRPFALAAKVSRSVYQSPIVGRDAEIQEFREDQTRLIQDAKGGVSIIDGEPGIGKSRLISTILENAQENGLTSYIGAALEIERSTPYFAWRGVFQKLLPKLGTSPADTTSRMTHYLIERGKPAEWLPLLNPILAMEFPETEFTAKLTQESRVSLTNSLLKYLLLIEAKLQPVLLILEDCHWLDSASWMLLREVAEATEDFLLLLVTRPLNPRKQKEYQRILEQCSPRQVSLKPLDEAAIEQLICQSLGVDRLPETVSQLIQEKAQGNPLFGEELAFALRDAGIVEIHQRDCRLQPGAQLNHLGFPDTIQGVVTSRIDRLNPNQQLTLKVASVVGRSFSCRILQDLFPIHSERVQQKNQLGTLTQRNLIVHQPKQQDLDYQFRHVITQEVAYDLIPPTQRQSLHQAIAEWYEDHYAADLSSYYPLLARHWSQTNNSRKTLYYLEKSGENAAKQFANVEVIQFFEQAISVAVNNEISISSQRLGQWKREIAEAHYNLGNIAESQQSFHQALEHLNCTTPQSPLRYLFGTVHELYKQFIKNAIVSPRVEKNAREAGRLHLAAQCYERLAQVHYLNNDRVPTMHAVFKSLDLARKVGPSSVLARCYANAAVIAGLMMLHGQARSYAKKANLVADHANDPDCRSYVGLILGIYWVTVGEWEIANKILGEALELAEKIGAKRRWAESAFTMVIGHWRQGQITQCRELSDKARENGKQERIAQVQLWGLSWSFRCLLAQSHDEALFRSSITEISECLQKEGLTSADLILGYGILAGGQWRLGNRPAAIEAAENVHKVITSSKQICHYVLPAYSSLFEVYSELSLMSETKAEKRNLRMRLGAIRSAMREFARMYPVGRPQYGFHQGRDLYRRGKIRAAVRLWKKSLRQAESMQMPLLRGLLHSELAIHLKRTGSEYSHDAEQARDLLTHCDAHWYAQAFESRISSHDLDSRS